MSDSAPPPTPPRPPDAGNPDPQLAPARVTAFDGCLGFFLGSVVGFAALMCFVGVAMSGRNMEGRPFAVLIAGVILAGAIWGAVLLKRKRPSWTRIAQGALIGLALMGIFLGLCVAISFS